MHREIGVVDIVVADEAEASLMANRVLACVQGSVADWQAVDQSELAALMPTNRRYAFDVRKIIHHLFDTESFIETRLDMGRAIITVLARVEGRAVAVLASDCRHLGGAIDGVCHQGGGPLPAGGKMAPASGVSDRYARIYGWP